MRVLKAAAQRLRKPALFRNWRPIAILVLLGYVVMLFLNCLYGFYPARFSLKHKQFRLSKAMMIYCLTVATIFGLFYVQHIWQEFFSGQIDQRDAIKIYCYMNACGSLLHYLYQWSICVRVRELLNQTSIFAVINYFDVTVLSMARHMVPVFIKIFIFPLVMNVTLLVYHQHLQQQHSQLSWLTTSTTMLPIIAGSQLNNCYFCSIVISKAIFKQINVLLAEMLTEVNRLQTPAEMSLHKPFYRMQRFCDLADRLDELADKYALVNDYCQGLLEFGCFSMVTTMSINLCNTTLGCYVQYQAFVDTIMLEKPYDIAQAVAHFVFLVLPFLEILLLANETQELIDEARKAGYLLQRMNLEHADVRFKQEVDFFWLEVRTVEFKLMPMGFLELDGSIVNKMYSTVAGFLLFLIQNDLTVRFSLK
ncbi:hypothetical protein KR215_009345 [Drosophila sulfurigaster]|nr:hypothetical protein KR215_009345 [Drosophila sulfurigaster]